MKLVLAVSLLVACHGGTSGPNPDVDAAGSGDAIDAPPVVDDFTTLIQRDWTITTSGNDQWECRRIQIPNDLWISGFRAMAQLGVLEEILTVSDQTPPSYRTNNYDCSSQIEDFTMIYAAADGTGDVTFPAGYAVHLKAGQWIDLNIHLVKPGGASTGTSGVQVKTIAPTADLKPIDMMFLGKLQFSIDHNGLDENIVGGCNLPANSNWDIFALWPRMHRIGKHQKVEVIRNGTLAHETMMDTDFSLQTEQTFHPAAPPVHVGCSSTTGCDHLQVTCTYNNNNTNNPGGTTVTFGDRLIDENCFNAFYKYPAGGALFDCAIQ